MSAEKLTPLSHVELNKLVRVCGHKTGQSYKVRALLYSLWNGKPASLLELVTLDAEIKIGVLRVAMYFGTSEFFYDQIKDAFVVAGLFEWFCEEGEK